MANEVKTIFTADKKAHDRTQSQLERDLARYQRDQERREKDITRAFEREARNRQKEEQRLLRESEREYARMAREKERQEKAITRATLQEIRLREQAQKEADAEARFRAQQLENFRQGVAARGGGVPQGGSFFSRISGYQRGQLAMQGGDVFTQLAMGQSPVQVAIQQGPQIAQILAQTKSAQEGIAKASSASATAQAIFAANSKEAAMEIAKGHQSMMLLGASAIGLGTILAAGLVTIGAVYKLAKDIEERAQKRLQREIDITKEYNRQNIALGELNKRLKEAENARSFGTFAGGDDVVGLRIGLASRQQQRQQLAAEVLQKQTYYNKLLQLPGLPADVLKQAFPKEAEDRLQRLDDEILSITERLATIKQQQKDAFSSTVIEGAMRSAAAVRERLEQQAAEAAKKRIELLEKEKKRIEDVKKALQDAFQLGLSTQAGNPFLDLLSTAYSRMRSLLETTKELGPTIRNALAGMYQQQSGNALFGLRLDSQLGAASLRNQAQEFRQGYRNDMSNPATVQRLLNQQLSILGLSQNPFGGGAEWLSLRDPAIAGGAIYEAAIRRAGQPNINVRPYDYRGLSMVAPSEGWENAARSVSTLTREQQAKIDQSLLNYASSIDPSLLTPGQRNTIASAFEREADRKLNAEKEALDFYASMKDIISKEGLKVNIDKAAMLDILINDPNGRTSQGGSSGNVNARYGRQR